MKSSEFLQPSPTSAQRSQPFSAAASPVSGRDIRHKWLIGVLAAPLLIACILTLLGLPVRGTDDINYVAALGTLNVRDLVVEQASWLLLNLPGSMTSDTTLALRLAGLIAVCLSVWAMTRSNVGPYGLAMFAVSVAPLYFVLYFAQLRFLVAFLIFVIVFSNTRFRLLSGPASLLGHLTGIIFAFPPVVALVAPLVGLASYLDPTNIVSLKISAYLGAEYFARPWYFGWELAILAAIYLLSGRWFTTIMITVTLIGIYMASDVLGVIVSRRLIELSLLAYSPIVYYLRNKALPHWSMLGFYIALGFLGTATSLAGGVVKLGG